MKALIQSSLAIQILPLTAAVLAGTTVCWFSICELTVEWAGFSSHAVLLTLIVSVSATTAGLTLFVVRQKVFEPLRLIQQYNTKQVAECTADDCAVMLIPEGLIPRGEIGQLIRSRNMMLQYLEKTLRELQVNYRTIADLEKLKDNLTLMIVHDLKNPLGVILLAIDVLQKNIKETQNQRQLFHHIRGSGRQILAMIQNLLDISKMEEQKLNLHLAPLDLQKRVTEIVHDLTAHSGAQKRAITVIAGDNVPEIHADEDLIRRVVDNLLSNAIKHTAPNGRIEVDIENSTRGAVLLKVSDNGVGIPKEDHARIFDKFEQVTLKNVNRRTSSGLGLTFCKLAVEAHGGRIWVESEIGRGSTFFVQLPVVQQNDHQQPEDASSSMSPLAEMVTKS